MNRASILAQFPGFAPTRIPQDVFVFFDDFLGASWSDTDDDQVWNSTNVGDGGTLSVLDGTDEATDEAGGALSLVTGATADDGENLQVNGEAFHLEDDFPLYFEARFNIQDVSNMDFFVGLAVTDAEIITGAVTDRIGFELSAGTLSAISEQDNTQETTSCGITETDDQWVRVAFYWNGDNDITFYVDDDDDGDFDEVVTLQQATAAHDIPDDMMLTPTIEAITGTTAVAQTCYVDYVFCAQQRYHA